MRFPGLIQGSHDAVCYRVGNARANMRNPRMLSTDQGGNRVRQNGNVPTTQTQTSNTAPRTTNNDDIDIQILQQKKQQAEIKRYVEYILMSIEGQITCTLYSYSIGL